MILYADNITNSIKYAIDETERRRKKQTAYNIANGISPATVKKNIGDILGSVFEGDYITAPVSNNAKNSTKLVGHELDAHIRKLEKAMLENAANLEFEEAARLRDEIKQLQAEELFYLVGKNASNAVYSNGTSQQIKKKNPRSTGGKPGKRSGRGKTTK